MTGFLNAKNSRVFMAELWTLLTSAMENEMGIPEEFVEEKKKELRRQQVERFLVLLSPAGVHAESFF